ncbi:hypothetical protein TOK_4114 [Pseudonocardia sp. N23]|nr:hypothetical protein TOK_4114 [Pseudonocardia sp. N23]
MGPAAGVVRSPSTLLFIRAHREQTARVSIVVEPALSVLVVVAAEAGGPATGRITV